MSLDKLDHLSEALVVVGNGMATTRLVEELLARGYDGHVTVLGDEPVPAYNRILLSAVLEGTHARDAITLRESWDDERVTLRLGTRVLEIDRERGEVMLVDGRRIGASTGSCSPPAASRRCRRSAAWSGWTASCTRRCTRSAASRTATGSTGRSGLDRVERRRPRRCARSWWAGGCSASRWPAR